MIASRPLHDAMRSVGRNGLDLPVAALAALAALFVTFAMPGDILAGLVGATGLPSLLPAAEPPLGMTARIAIGATGAAAVFALVFFLLRVLDRSMLGGAPKLRRRDAHPDAPVPRPISAARDLGEPAPPVRPQAAPAPLWLAEPEPEPAPRAPESLAELMARLERGLAGRRAPSAAAPAPQVFPEAGDDRLQSAIDSLQRLAARQY